MSWLAATHLGAIQLNKFQVQSWSEPIFEAFLAGAWLLHWTDDTLFWIAKPTVHVEQISSGRRLHNASYAAVESDLENLYFFHGILVPAFVIVRPESITVKDVLSEENVEVRRVFMERMGMQRFLTEAGAKCIHRHEMGELFSIDLPGDPEGVLRSVRVKDPSTDREYFLRVPPKIKRADDAVAWTFGFEMERKQEYRPVVET
jgi:hypothetical protein